MCHFGFVKCRQASKQTSSKTIHLLTCHCPIWIQFKAHILKASKNVSDGFRTNIPTKVSTWCCWGVVTTSAAGSLTWCNNNNKKDMLDQIVVEVCNDEDAGDNDKWHDFGLPFPVELISCLNGTCKIKQAPAVASSCQQKRHKQNKVQKVLWKNIDIKYLMTSGSWLQKKPNQSTKKNVFTHSAPFWLAQVFLVCSYYYS